MPAFPDGCLKGRPLCFLPALSYPSPAERVGRVHRRPSVAVLENNADALHRLCQRPVGWGRQYQRTTSTLNAIDCREPPPRRSPMARVDPPRKGEGEGATRLWTGPPRLDYILRRLRILSGERPC